MADSKLKQIFEKYLDKVDKAVTWVDAGQRWYVSKCVICCLNTKEPDAPVSKIKDKETFVSLEKDKTTIYPENFIKEEYQGFTWEFKRFITGQNSAIALQADKSFPLKDTDYPIRVYWIMDDYANKVWKESKPEDCYLAFNKQGLAMLKLCQGEDYAYIACGFETKPQDIELTKDGKKYKVYDWDQSTKTYKRMEEIMSKLDLPDLSKLGEEIGKAVGIDLNAAGISLDKTEEQLREEKKKENDTENKKEAVSEIKEVEATDKEKEATKESAEEGNKEEGTENSDSGEVKRTRKRSPNKPKPIVLSEVIEHLNNPIPEDMKDDDILTEIRQLRDLSQVVSRRMSNLATERIMNMQKEMKMFEQIKALIK